MRFLGHLIFSLLVIVLPAHAAEVGVSATVDRNQVAVGDVINLTVTVNSGSSGQVEEPRLPSLSNFELINTSSGVETRSTFINGKFETEQSRTYSYMLAPSRQGQLTIPSVSVNIDGKTYNTDPIVITVSKARPGQARRRQAPQNPNQNPFGQMDQMEQMFNKMLQRQFGQGFQGGGGGAQPGAPPDQNMQINPNEAFFIHAEVDKTKVYVGQQVTAKFYLYTRGQIRDIDTLKYPELKGFWKEELDMATRLNFEPVVVNGIQYQRALLVSYALFPINPGKALVDPYKAKCTVITPSNFGFGQPFQYTKASRAIPIEVLPDPSPEPADFTGAVGNFRIQARFEPTTGVVNQPVTLRIRVEGKGNAKLIDLPELNLPKSFELYDKKSDAQFLKDATSFKNFQVLIIPREAGVFKIPPLKLAVFNPESGKYGTIQTAPLQLAVTGAPGEGMTQVPVVPGTTAPGPKAGAPSGPELPPLATEFDSASVPASMLNGITIGLFLLVLSFLGWQGWTRLKRKPKKVNLKMALNRRMKSVRESAGRGDWRRVGVELTNAIYFILGGISEQGGANQELARLLEKAPPSLRNELSQPIQQLLSQCEALSFAPETMVGDMTAKDRLQRLVGEAEKLMNRAIELAEN